MVSHLLYYIYGWSLLHLWSVLHVLLSRKVFITFMGDNCMFWSKQIDLIRVVSKLRKSYFYNPQMHSTFFHLKC